MQKRRSGGYIQHVVLETGRKQAWGGGGWLTGGNLAREETQEQEQEQEGKKKHARSFKDGSAVRLMHTRTEKHTQ